MTTQPPPARPPAPIAWDQPRPRNPKFWPAADVIAGAVLILARIIVPDIPGLVFKGSISQVQGICNSGIGALAQAASASATRSCGYASTAIVVLDVAAVVGAVLLAYGGWKLAVLLGRK